MDNLTNKKIVKDFFEIYNSKNYKAAYECMAADYKDRMLTQVTRVEHAIEILKATHQAFPDIQVIIRELIEEGDKVVFRGQFTGTHLGEFAGIAATGAKVDFEALEIFRVENGKIAESWGYWPMDVITSQIQGSGSAYS
ncbi:MAG: ester cyclase [Oscillatoria sp. SIO1A7]|nr:ester cyclase [Oscillatoria sp. SIO1A7]